MQNTKSKLKRIQEKERRVYIPVPIYSPPRRRLPPLPVLTQPELLSGPDPTAPPQAGPTCGPRGFGLEFSLHENHVSRYLAVFLGVFNLGC